jgi:hypothetical protein
MGLQELINDAFVFFRFSRTGTIDQHPARPQAQSRCFKDLKLQCVVSFELLTALPPLAFRMPA